MKRQKKKIITQKKISKLIKGRFLLPFIFFVRNQCIKVEIKKPIKYNIVGIIKNNAEKAQYYANKTLRKVQKKVGFPEKVR